LAQRIATPIEVVQALEQGAIYALPPWPETCRVVNAYGTLLNLDTRPLLRRIYAQLEAGIVELRPKAMPDVPVMAPQSGGDASFGGPVAQPPRQAPQAMPQAPSWPNGGGAPQQQAPQPQAPQPRGPRPQASQPQAPQPHAWPGGAPQYPQNAPGQAPQAPAWSNGPQAPQPWAPEPRAPQPQAYPAEPQYQPAQRDYAQEPPVEAAEDASFPGEAEEEPKQKQKRPALLKWGIAALVAAVVLIGLWLALGDSSSDRGSSSGFNASDPVLDPDDPRSRKADRLPNNF
jgi:hypothetical protein